jgi:putative NADPH-quinone reductase
MSPDQKCSVLGLAGSPRKDGNTDLLLREALRGAADGGAEAEFLPLRSQKIGPCVECGRCQLTGRCALHDDIGALHAKLLAADHVVFASPIFFVGVSAQAKLLIDRCQCFWSLEFVLRKPLFDPPRPHRRGLFIACCGSNEPWMFDGARRTVKAWFQVLALRYAGELLYPGIDPKGAILEHPTALAEAYHAGLALARGTELAAPSRP